jgi:hypothetical protein
MSNLEQLKLRTYYRQNRIVLLRSFRVRSCKMVSPCSPECRTPCWRRWSAWPRTRVWSATRSGRWTRCRGRPRSWTWGTSAHSSGHVNNFLWSAGPRVATRVWNKNTKKKFIAFEWKDWCLNFWIVEISKWLKPYSEYGIDLIRNALNVY